MGTVCIRTLSIHLLSAASHLCPFLSFGVSFCLCFSEIKRNQSHVCESIIPTVHTENNSNCEGIYVDKLKIFAWIGHLPLHRQSLRSCHPSTASSSWLQAPSPLHPFLCLPPSFSSRPLHPWTCPLVPSFSFCLTQQCP